MCGLKHTDGHSATRTRNDKPTKCDNKTRKTQTAETADFSNGY